MVTNPHSLVIVIVFFYFSSLTNYQQIFLLDEWIICIMVNNTLIQSTIVIIMPHAGLEKKAVDPLGEMDNLPQNTPLN